MFEEAVKPAFSVLALVLALVSEADAFLVVLADNAPLDAVALLFAEPVVVEVLPPLEALLLFVELPTIQRCPLIPPPQGCQSN